MEKILLIIPAYNEAENIISVVEEVKRDLPQVDILIVNDCSTDNTLDILKKTEGITYVSQPFNLGYSNAVQLGFKYAAQNGYDYVIQFDGDGQHIATEAAKLLNIAEKSDYDIVIGSRYKQAKAYKQSFFRKLGTDFFVALIKIICRVKISDPTSGLQVLDKKVFTLYSKMYGYPEFPDANLLIELLFRGFKITEEDVKMRQRQFGVSMHSGIIKPVKYMIEVFYAILLLLPRKRALSKNSRLGKA